MGGGMACARTAYKRCLRPTVGVLLRSPRVCYCYSRVLEYSTLEYSSPSMGLIGCVAVTIHGCYPVS